MKKQTRVRWNDETRTAVYEQMFNVLGAEHLALPPRAWETEAWRRLWNSDKCFKHSAEHIYAFKTAQSLVGVRANRMRGSFSSYEAENFIYPAYRRWLKSQRKAAVPAVVPVPEHYNVNIQIVKVLTELIAVCKTLVDHDEQLIDLIKSGKFGKK